MTILPIGTKIVILRHGESEGNAQKIMQGSAEYPLTPLGIEQSLMARSVVEGWSVAHWIASDLSRAVDTAKLLSALAEVHMDPRLRERGAGPWEGLPRSVLETAYPGSLENDALREELGFELATAMVARSLESLTDVMTHEGLILVVSHGAVMRFLERYLGGDGARFRHLDGLAISSELKLLGRVSTINPIPSDEGTR